jgi:hypothetical protein
LVRPKRAKTVSGLTTSFVNFFLWLALSVAYGLPALWHSGTLALCTRHPSSCTLALSFPCLPKNNPIKILDNPSHTRTLHPWNPSIPSPWPCPRPP